MSRSRPRPATPEAHGSVRYPGEAFGLSPTAAGRGVRRDPPVPTQQIGALTAWSVRLRVAAEAQRGLAGVVLAACDEASLIGPAGDALRDLGRQVSTSVHEAAAACHAAADELDLAAVQLVLTPTVLTPTGGVE